MNRKIKYCIDGSETQIFHLCFGNISLPASHKTFCRFQLKIPISFRFNSFSLSVFYYFVASKTSRQLSPKYMSNINEVLLTPTNKRLPLTRSPRQLTTEKTFCCCNRSRIVGYPHCILPFEIKSERRKNNIIKLHVYVFQFSVFLSFFF